MPTVIESQHSTVELNGHLFEVWVNIWKEAATRRLVDAAQRDADARNRDKSWCPYWCPKHGTEDIALSILDAANIGVRYLGPGEQAQEPA